ncbi:MAG: hypothetical protein WCO77_00820 [bacterium]
MRRAGRTNPRLQEKLDALQRELDRVQNDIKGISKAVETPDQDQALKQLRRVTGLPLKGEANLARPAAEGILKDSTDAIADKQQLMVAGLRPVQNFPAETGDMRVPKAVTDQRFTTYFGSGSLHSVRPLRQELRVQRNRALLMLFLAIVFLYGVYKMIF